MAASSYFTDEGQSGSPVLPATRSSSDGTDIRWFFSKHPLPPDALAASIPKNAIVGRGEFLRFSARDSLALEAAYKKNEAYYDRAWWRELAECSSGPEGAPSSPPLNAAGDEDPMEDTMGVPVKGGLYEVELETRRSFPVYWKGEDRRVLRGQWFARTHSSHWLPLREDVADQLEVAYQRRVWRGRSYEPSGLYAARVPLAGAHQGQSVLFTGEDSSWEAWLANEAAWWPQVEPGIPLRRGFISSLDSGAFTQEDVQQEQEEERDDYCSQVPVAHVLLMVHGIGQRMDTAHFVDDVTIFRRHTAALAEHHLTKDQRQRHRCLFIPCQWRRELRLAGEAAVEDITPGGVPALRKNVSATVHDVLFYMSPAYCQDIIDSVTSQLNFQYRKFVRRNPGFVGKVSIFGHSLGSVLAFDILCHQDIAPPSRNKPVHPPTDPHVAAAMMEGGGRERKATAATGAYTSNVGKGQASSPALHPSSDAAPGGSGPSAAGPEGRWQSGDLPLRTDRGCSEEVEESEHHSSYTSAPGGFHPYSNTPGTSEEGGREQWTAPPSPAHSLPTSLELAKRRRPPRQHRPDIDYARLDFEVDTLFAVGSPLALFLVLRNIRIGTGDGPEQLEGIAEEVPACRRLLNIFHPYDPVAYRIEPLISREYVKIPPAYLAHFKGGRRLHIALQELSDKLGGRVRHVAKGWLRCYQKIQVWTPQRLRIVSDCTQRGLTIPLSEENVQLRLEVDDYARHVMTRLTGRAGGRIDYVLQEATFDYQYIVAFKCHLTYWSDWDTALCVIRHLYDDTDIEAEAAGSVDVISLNPSASVRDKEREALDNDQQIALTFQSGGRGPVGLLRALQVARGSSRKSLECL